MILRFKTPVNRNGYAKQIELDVEKKKAKCGYFIFAFKDAITLSPKGYNELLKMLESNQIEIIHD